MITIVLLPSLPTATPTHAAESDERRDIATQLSFNFVAANTMRPVNINTHMTFYDLDEGWSGIRECTQIRGSGAAATRVTVSPSTELERFDFEPNAPADTLPPTVQDILSLATSNENVTDFIWSSADPMATPLLCSGQRGFGEDNPDNPANLTEQQVSRAIMYSFDSVSTFDVRFSLSGGTGGTGRNLLFAGYRYATLP